MEIFSFIFSLVIFIGFIVIAIFMIKSDESSIWPMLFGATLSILMLIVLYNLTDVITLKKRYPYCMEVNSYKLDTTNTITNGIPTDTIYILHYKKVKK